MNNVFWKMAKDFLTSKMPLLNNWNIPAIEAQAGQIAKEKILEKVKEAAPAPAPVYTYPIRSNRVSSKFGYRTLTIDGKKVQQFHYGIDLVPSPPSSDFSIIAPEDMIIKKVLPHDPAHPCLFRWDNKIGFVKETPPAGKKWGDGTWAWTPYITAIGIHTKIMYIFRHSITTNAPGAEIKSGAVFGKFGNYGYSMGAHLHFETWPLNEKQQAYPNPDDPQKVMGKLIIS